jgi:hypothetical protein
MMRKSNLLVFCMVFFCSVMLKGAEGGYTNFIPGFYGDFGLGVEPDSNFLVKYDYYNYSADANRSVRSGSLELGIDLEVQINFLTVYYKPELEFFDAQYATAITFAYTQISLDSSALGGGTALSNRETNSRLGDLTIAPIILYWKQNNFNISFTEYIVIPTANYDTEKVLNTGLNYWSFDTNLGVTYLNEETGQDYSINIGHIYNTENSDTHYKSGQEFHLHFIANQFLSEKFAIGAQAFYYKQITGDSGSGALLGDFKSETKGIGPQLLYIKDDFSLSLKWLHEFDSENRLEGDNLYLSVVYSF